MRTNQKLKNIILLDLFRLHNSIKDDVPRKWIVVKGNNFKISLKKLIKELESKGISNTYFVKHLMKKFNISIASAERLVYLKKDWFPLIFIKELLKLLGKKDMKFEIQKEIKFIKTNQPPEKILIAPKQLSVNLCKIAGAHAADGTIHKNYFCITDRYKDNISAFRKWLDKEFNLEAKIERISDNEWGIRFHNKVFTRYLNLLSFPSGCKQYTVKEPDIIKRSSLEFRKAFAIGALTFEAGIGIKHQIELCVASKGFRDSINEIMRLHDIKHKSMKKPSSSYWRLWSNTLTKEEAKKWSEFFEPKTEKWFKLRDFANGFSQKVNSFEEAVAMLDAVYPVQSSSKIALKDVLLALDELKQTYRYELAKYLIKNNNLNSYGGKWAHSLKQYLDILKKANIVSVEKRMFGKKKSFGSIVREIYCFNENITEWRLPERKNGLTI